MMTPQTAMNKFNEAVSSQKSFCCCLPARPILSLAVGRSTAEAKDDCPDKVGRPTDRPNSSFLQAIYTYTSQYFSKVVVSAKSGAKFFFFFDLT